MRLLTRRGSAVGCAMALLALAVTVPQSAAHPPEAPAHGINESTHHTLWTGDVDSSNATARDGDASALALAELAAGTDFPLDAPPRAVERWNRGDLSAFPATTADTSVHPSDATLTDGDHIRDAYAAVFAVQPSTRARLTPGDQPLYVAPEGTLLGTVDYRVDPVGGWRLDDHRIAETRLLVDGAAVATGDGTHTPRLSYHLDGQGGTSRTLTLEADVEVELSKRVSVCGTRNNTTCVDWVVWTEHTEETVTVRDSVAVVAYDLAVAGHKARYPNGDLGLVVYKNQPWLGYSVPEGSVNGVWRFYAARDTGWDTLVTSRADGESVAHSPLHPLQVHAFPIEPGPTASPRETVTILDTYGTQTKPAALPADVHLDVLEEPYTASYGLVTRTETVNSNYPTVRVSGLVRGVALDATPSTFATVPIHRSNLSVSVLATTRDTVTARARLQDAQTGAPINTDQREGYVVLAGERVNTSENGTVTRTVPRSGGGVTARYEPGRWWFASTGYVGDSDVVYVRGTVLDALAAIYEIGVPVSLFLLGVFIIDRITGWGVWPPWRWL